MLSVSMGVSGLGSLSESTSEVKAKLDCGLCDINCKSGPLPPFGNISMKYHPQDF